MKSGSEAGSKGGTNGCPMGWSRRYLRRTPACKMLPEQQEGKIREDREATVEGRMMSSLIENGKNEEGWQMGLLDLPTGGLGWFFLALIISCRTFQDQLFNHITPLLLNHQWLPCMCRMNDKCLGVAFKGVPKGPASIFLEGSHSLSLLPFMPQPDDLTVYFLNMCFALSLLFPETGLGMPPPPPHSARTGVIT